MVSDEAVIGFGSIRPSLKGWSSHLLNDLL